MDSFTLGFTSRKFKKHFFYSVYFAILSNHKIHTFVNWLINYKNYLDLLYKIRYTILYAILRLKFKWPFKKWINNPKTTKNVITKCKQFSKINLQ